MNRSVMSLHSAVFPAPRHTLRTKVIQAAGGLHGRFRSIVAGDGEVALTYDGMTCYATALTSKKPLAGPPLVATRD